ncbi:MAG TPA: HdeD family acid-resistance protein [Actinoplanes sp.]|jgi:uncharacterized membrane protein HdeD (DUF308 family)
MLETLTRYWWATALRGVLAILFGVTALVWPGITVFALVLIFGAYSLVDGAFTLATALGRRDRGGTETGSMIWLVVQGIAGVMIGVLAFVWPGITAVALLWLIGIWAIVIGVLEVVAAIRLRRQLRREWLLGLSGAVTALFGILLIAWPAAGVLTLVTLIGIAAVVFGVGLVAFALRLRRRQRPVTGSHSLAARA